MSLLGFCHQYNHKDASSINKTTSYTRHYWQHYNVCPLVVTSSGEKTNSVPLRIVNQAHSFLMIPYPSWLLSADSYLSADVFGLLWKLVRVLLMVLTHSPVHLFPFDALLALAKGRLTLYHLKDQAAQPPPVRAEGVALILDHLRSYTEETSNHVNGAQRSDLFMLISKWSRSRYPCIQRCPLSLVSSLLQGFEQRDPGQKFECVLHTNKKRCKI